MTRWLGLDILFLWLSRQFLKLVVKAQLQPDSTDGLNIDLDKPICYVLKNESLSDYLIFDREAHRMGLPTPSTGLTLGNTTLKSAAFFLSPKGWVWQRKKLMQSPPKPLTALIQELRETAGSDIQMVPVSLFWGRAPKRENSFFKIIFSDNWRVPGMFGKFLLILIQGRQAVIHVDEPVSLREVMEEGLEDDLTVRKIGRLFRTHFRRRREAFIGPDLSHRRTLLNTLLHQPRVAAAIKEASDESGKPAKTWRKARKYAKEIAADYSHSIIQLYDLVLTWLWDKIYEGMVVNGLERVNKVATDNVVIFVPCHRSHIDYLLLSYFLFKGGSAAPHIAAGVNLNMPVIGPILRRGGAFFMRRSFKGDKLYGAVFNEYLNMMFDRGFSVEYFVEGGRSRTGRLLPPRPGMLAMTVRSFLRSRRRNFVFVPVHVSYEKVLEGGSYLGELYGKKKKQESVFGFVGALRKINNNFGRVYINFGEPIHLNDCLDQHQPQWRELYYDDNAPPQWLSDTVTSLGTSIVTRINKAVVVNPVNLLSLVLLSTPKHAMDERTLVRHLNFCLHYLQQVPYSEVALITEMKGSDILEYCERQGVLERKTHPLGDVVFFTEEQALLMTYYRNNIIHLFVLVSLTACLVLQHRRITREKLIEQINRLYCFFKTEFFIHWRLDEVPEVIEQSIEVLVASGHLEGDQMEVWAPDNRAAKFIHLNTLANVTKHSLERFFITVEILVRSGTGSMNAEQLEKACTMLAQRMSLLHELSGPEFSDKTLFRNYIQSLLDNDLLVENEDGYLEFDDSLHASHLDAQALLSADTRQSIQQITEIDLEKELLKQQAP